MPVIPTVASPKNIMGSRPYKLLDQIGLFGDRANTMMDVVKSTVCVEKYATAP